MKETIAVDEVIASLPRGRQKTFEARGNELLARVARRTTLGEMRKSRKITQARMAKAMEIG